MEEIVEVPKTTEQVTDEIVRDIFETRIKMHLSDCINNRIIGAIELVRGELYEALAMAKCANMKIDKLLLELKPVDPEPVEEKETEDE